jgi:hypothetical protein
VRLDGFFLARYAELDAGGTLSVLGGGWTTWNVHGPVVLPPEQQGEGDEPAAIVSGALVARLLLSPEESDGEHRLRILLRDDEDADVFDGEVVLGASRDPELPRSWEQPATLTLPLSGIAVARFGLYRFCLEHEGGLLGACRFQVVKRYGG